MAQLVVRNIESSVKTQLQRRAKRHGRSMEEEVRDILRDAANEEDAPSGRLGNGHIPSFQQGGPWLRHSRTTGT
jgi:antitoxin FitA